MKSLLTVAFAFTFAGAVAAQGDHAKHAGAHKDAPCDLKTVEKTPFCAKCKTIDPKVDDKGECCGGKPESVEVCVKTTFSCGKCSKPCAEDKGCCEGAECAKTVTKCRVVVKCEGCGMESKDGKESDCGMEECKKAGKKCKKTCENSGHWPHGGEAPRE